MSKTRPTRRKSPAGALSPPSPPTSPSPSSCSAESSPTREGLSRNRQGSTPSRWQRFYTTYEVPRKALHSGIGIAGLGLYMIPQVTPARLVALGIPACAIIVSADLLRFNNPAFAKLYEQHLGYLMRPTEKNRWNGVIFYLIGALLVLSLLPTDIATLSVLLLSWCDTAASLVGRAIGSYGPRIRRGKSLFGTLAAWLTGALTTAFFFDRIVPLRPGLVPAWDRSLSSLSLLQVSVLGGIVAAVSEAVDVFGLDDNLTIPVLSGGMLWAVLCWAGYGRA